jgi:hypothetical protein
MGVYPEKGMMLRLRWKCYDYVGSVTITSEGPCVSGYDYAARE